MATITQDTVISAWLNAENDSPRFKTALLTEAAQDLDRIMRGSDPGLRMDLLVAARGRQVSNFPWHKVTWQEATITSKDELGNLRVCPGMHWLAFTDGDRLLSHAAEWVAKQPARLDPHMHVEGVMRNIESGEPILPLIVYIAQNGAKVLLEGHVRSAAYYLSPKTRYPITIYLATPQSPDAFKRYDPGYNLAEIRERFIKGESA